MRGICKLKYEENARTKKQIVHPKQVEKVSKNSDKDAENEEATVKIADSSTTREGKETTIADSSTTQKENASTTKSKKCVCKQQHGAFDFI